MTKDPFRHLTGKDKIMSIEEEYESQYETLKVVSEIDILKEDLKVMSKSFWSKADKAILFAAGVTLLFALFVFFS